MRVTVTVWAKDRITAYVTKDAAEVVCIDVGGGSLSLWFTKTDDGLTGKDKALRFAADLVEAVTQASNLGAPK